MSPSPQAVKVQRWVDLIAALLAHRRPLPFEELAQYVPAYLADGSIRGGKPSPSLKRMFERDKKELREFGVPIVTDGDTGADDCAYQLSPDDFYLPYLTITTPGRRPIPKIVDRYRYRTLSRFSFEPDELAIIAEAAHRTTLIDDSLLERDVSSAMRKLAFDLPVDDFQTPNAAIVTPTDGRMLSPLLDLLSDALLRRKRVRFHYRTMESGATAVRNVESYGLFFLNAHWYLVGRDISKDQLRNFRVSRMHEIEVNMSKTATPDYRIPSTFRLRDHARSRQAWELGDGDAIEATIEFSGNSGPVIAAAALGSPVPNFEHRRLFRVQRIDTFVRWLLSFAGDAVPLAPPELIDAYQSLVKQTRKLYSSPDVEHRT